MGDAGQGGSGKGPYTYSVITLGVVGSLDDNDYALEGGGSTKMITYYMNISA